MFCATVRCAMAKQCFEVKKYSYTQHDITEEDIKAISDVLANEKDISGTSRIVARFEEALCEYTGYKYAIAMNSCTSALLTAYSALKQTGKISASFVSMPALTFVATMNAAILSGLNVVIRDINYNTLTMDNLDVGVSYAGHPVKAKLINDDAHRLYRNMADDNTSLVSCISTHPAKHITTGEGGALLTNDCDIQVVARKLCSHARNNYIGEFPAYNFRMPAINAALGLSQLNRLDAMQQRRNEIVAFYTEAFLELHQNNIALLPNVALNHAWHLYVLRIQNNRDKVKEDLDNAGIHCQIHYPPLTRHYDSKRIINTGVPSAEYAHKTCLSIPMHSLLADKDLVFISEKVYETISKYS